MKKFKLSLLAATAVCAIAASAMSFTAAAAADDADYREVTLTGTNVFYTGVDAAAITAVTVEDDSEEGSSDYTAFAIGNDESVTFRKNLAYSWWEADENGFGVNGKFSMTIGFEDISFESYTIAFDSQQYNITENGVSKNYLIFVPAENSLELYVSQSEELAEGEVPDAVLVDYSSVDIAFGDYTAGDYTLLVNGEEKVKEGASEPAKFINVSRNYASYVSSGDSAATPITFSADLGEDAGEDDEAVMIMYSLNGQSFKLYGAEVEDGKLTDGKVHDDKAPVVCLDGNLNYLTYGGKVDFDYTTIDVIASSPRTTVRYYVLTNEQFTAEDYDYNNTDVEEELFMEVSTSSDYRLLRDQYTYVPGLTDAGIEQNDEGYSTYGLVKVCLYVRDTTSSRARTDYVFMDWYVPAEYKVDISQIKGTASTASSTFIMMASDGRGATYGDDTVTDLESYKQYIARVQEDYQAKIDESIANDYPDGLYASSETNLYLPDFSGYVTDNLGGYTDLEYAIYYRSSSNGSSTGLASDELAMTVSQADVTYRFTIYVTDAAGNDMYYPDENGELVTISADDVWEDDYAELLPFFEVTVDYRAATVEEPGVQNVGYVGSTYNSASFEIKGVDATYSAVYNLYIFDRDAFYGDTGVELSYNDVVDNAYALFYNEYKDFENTRQYFTLVTDEEEYEDYEWNSTNVTFVPQDPSMFYVVRLTLTDTGLSNKVTNSFLVVRASERAAELYGEDNWVENNIAAIVLFCVAGVFLVAFVALLIIKPKDKGDIDVIAEQLAEDKKSKKAK